MGHGSRLKAKGKRMKDKGEKIEDEKLRRWEGGTLMRQLLDMD